jgi:hypothetical protein
LREDIAAKKKDLRDTIIIAGVKFSKEVKTFGEGDVASWATFKDPPEALTPTHQALSAAISDRMPAIVVSAKYTAGEGSGCGGEAGKTCTDKLEITFSEPIKRLGDINDTTQVKNPFEYQLVGDGEKDMWKRLRPEAVPGLNRISWSEGGKLGSPTNEEGNTKVTLRFNRWRSTGGSSYTPMPADYVRFWYTEELFIDMAEEEIQDTDYLNGGLNKDPEIFPGNFPNKREIGRMIEGKKPFLEEKIPIADVDTEFDVAGNAKNTINDILGGKAPDKLFDKTRPVEILPVDPNWSPNEVKNNYPGTVGIILNPDISNTINDLKEQQQCDVRDEDILISANAFYHTNLGNYVANRSISLRCNDPIFPQSSCLDLDHGNTSKVYIAWNTKDDKGRWAGAGAYVGVYDFRWEITAGACKATYDNMERKIEMHGVKRVRRR